GVPRGVRGVPVAGADGGNRRVGGSGVPDRAGVRGTRATGPATFNLARRAQLRSPALAEGRPVPGGVSLPVQIAGVRLVTLARGGTCLPPRPCTGGFPSWRSTLRKGRGCQPHPSSPWANSASATLYCRDRAA